VSLVEQATEVMAISDLEGGTPFYLNKAGLKLVGLDSLEEARTRRGIHYIFPEDRQFLTTVVWPAVREQGSWSGEIRLCHFKTGDPIPVFYSAFRIDDPTTGQPVYAGQVCSDITDRKRAEEKLRASEQRLVEVQMSLAHANRVTTMGQLTASIAHEVKQPIGAVVTNAQAGLRFLSAEVVDSTELRGILLDVVADGNRASQVISRITDLTKKAPPRRGNLQINGAIREVVEFVRREAAKNRVLVHAELAEGLPIIWGDRVELQQVILNLVLNGIEAMQSVEGRARDLVIRSLQDEKQQVLVSVTDCGVGISAENTERLFNAFFTTKSSGMGMGLSICRSIIEAHNGRLWATVNLPHGATFQFALRSDAEAAS
jgi:PAS domain S-box-containing protein